MTISSSVLKPASLRQRLNFGGIAFDLGNILHEPRTGFRNAPHCGWLAESPMRTFEEFARIDSVERGLAHLGIVKRRLSHIENQAAKTPPYFASAIWMPGISPVTTFLTKA